MSAITAVRPVGSSRSPARARLRGVTAERIFVGRSLRHDVAAEIAARSAAIFHDERLAERAAEIFSQAARHAVAGHAGAERG